MMPSAVGALPLSEQQLPNGVLQAHVFAKNSLPCDLVKAGSTVTPTTVHNNRQDVYALAPKQIHDKVA